MTDREATDWRAAGRGERNCKMLAVHITWLASWVGLHGSFTSCKN